MRRFLFALSMLALLELSSAETTENPKVREFLREQEAQQNTIETNSEGEDTEKSLTTRIKPTSKYQQGPNHSSVNENRVCNDQLTVFAMRPSKAAPPLQTCEMQLDNRFADAIKKYIPLCAKEAAGRLGMTLPTSVSLEQMGAYNVRRTRRPNGNGSSWSRHAVGMAMDISALTLHNGYSSQKIDLTENTNNQNFYNSFRSCWDDSMKSFMGKECTCSIGHAHTHDPSNHLHNDHMHISLTCPSQQGVAGC